MPMTVSSADRSPQRKKGRKTSHDNFIAVKFSDNSSEIALSQCNNNDTGSGERKQ